MLHIYTAAMQLATDYEDGHGEMMWRGGWKPEELIRCECCGKKRLAKNCVVQCYYDGLRLWCAEGHGCKHPQAMAMKRRREHRNRSLAQQARRARERAADRAKIMREIDSRCGGFAIINV